MADRFIGFSPPSVGEEEVEAVASVLRSQWLTTGPRVREFEQVAADFLGAPAALAVSSCTAALHLSLSALGVGPGDDVITTPMTFAASVNVIEHVGARPILVDVEPDTLNIDPDALCDAVTPRTRVILPVHFAGHPVDLDPVHELAGSKGLHVVEDAAHAIPAYYSGRAVGSGLNPACFSFYATKNVTTIEGGLLTGEPGFIERARILSLHGMSKDAWKRYDSSGTWKYDVVAPGFKYNMTDLQAAIGLVQFEKLARFQKRRREIVEAYTRAFAGEAAFELPTERPDVEHAWHLYVLRLNLENLSIDRDCFIEELRKRNVGASVHFIPIHLHSYYRKKYGYAEMDFPVAYSNYLRMLSLPLHPGLSDADVRCVTEAVLDVVGNHGG